jgi:putative endonuclease
MRYRPITERAKPRRPTPPDPERQARYQRGRTSEWLASVALLARGYRILERRYRSPVGEIDIVARRGRRLAFVEVKRRPSWAEAETALSLRQAERIMRAAEHWLQRHAALADCDIGLDVILLVPRRLPRHVQDAYGRDWTRRSRW